jgi:N utilization substance protein A
MSRDFVGALLQLNAEKQVSREQLIRTVEEAIAAAYRRVANEEDIHVHIDADSGSIRVYRARIATTDPIDEDQQLTHFTLDEARRHKADAIPGELVETEQLDGDTFGRIGAQTAKQVVLQRLREAERDAVFDQFADREGELVTGTVNRVEPRAMILDMGKGVESILATTEQSPLEHYRIGQNVKAYVLEVRRTPRGPALFVSRTHKGFLKRLFELEVPEIHNGTVEIRAIAREAGSRSKVAVASRQEGLDPVGATVGQRGARVQAVVAELGGEKIDVIPWNDDPAMFVANALSPAQVLSVDIDQEHRIANVTVPERMLSLAIGREGQNARLAARLTGWRIDIRSDVSVAEAKAAASEAQAEAKVESAARTEPKVDAPTEVAAEESAPKTETKRKPKAGAAEAKTKAKAESKPADGAAGATEAKTAVVEPKATAKATAKATTKTRKAATAKAASEPATDGADPEPEVKKPVAVAVGPGPDASSNGASSDGAAKPRARRAKAAAGEVAS